MKRLVSILALASVVTACSTTGADPYAQRAAVAANGNVSTRSAIEQAPDWMSRLPKSEHAIYENGTATSGDFAMADMKAKAIAFAKICTAAGGKVRSQMKVYRRDTDDSSSESSEMAIRSICPDVDITGVETVEMKHVADGNRIRTYVLVALPFGDANRIKKANLNSAREENTERSKKEAFDELDTLVTGNPTKPNSAAATLPAAITGDKVDVVGQDGTPGQLQLLPVDNAAYKAKRNEALQKPGAVVGQATLPM